MLLCWKVVMLAQYCFPSSKSMKNGLQPRSMASCSVLGRFILFSSSAISFPNLFLLLGVQYPRDLVFFQPDGIIIGPKYSPTTLVPQDW